MPETTQERLFLRQGNTVDGRFTDSKEGRDHRRNCNTAGLRALGFKHDRCQDTELRPGTDVVGGEHNVIPQRTDVGIHQRDQTPVQAKHDQHLPECANQSARNCAADDRKSKNQAKEPLQRAAQQRGNRANDKVGQRQHNANGAKWYEKKLDCVREDFAEERIHPFRRDQ